eukprot:UN08407
MEIHQHERQILHKRTSIRQLLSCDWNSRLEFNEADQVAPA